MIAVKPHMHPAPQPGMPHLHSANPSPHQVPANPSAHTVQQHQQIQHQPHQYYQNNHSQQVMM